MSSSSKDTLYQRSGIDDVTEFYRTKFVSDEVLDNRYFKALDRFDIRFARTLWVYDNVRSGSSVLDLGCGAGMLALLKRKDITLVGVDLSKECALAAKRNGYDEAFAAELVRLPFADASFDYVVSLDVLGHVDFKEKDNVIAELHRVLRPGGVTLHGIECTDHSARRGFEEMSEDELRRFVAIDGHVGLEEEQEHAQRFRRFFDQVAWEPRYALCLSSEEFLKQADEYGIPFERDFLNYLRGLSFKERRAFDLAMGYVFAKISDLHIQLPKAGLYVFLKASDAPLGPFYNEHRDRDQLLGSMMTPSDVACLDRNTEAEFDEGWYEPNILPPVARWMSRRGRITFHASNLSEIRLDLTTHMPDLRQHPLAVELSLNGETLSAFSLFRHGWLGLRVLVPEPVRSRSNGRFDLELRADRTWQPRPGVGPDRDDREISIAVCNIEIYR